MLYTDVDDKSLADHNNNKYKNIDLLKKRNSLAFSSLIYTSIANILPTQASPSNDFDEDNI